ncbi:hypothetical protein HI914_00216 [Erysiphe necator]|nr:hypothetical protein HI914_00216 [Erysiphe necator]
MSVLTPARIWKVQPTPTNFVFTSQQITKLLLNCSKQELLHARLGHMGSEQTKRINLMVDGLNNTTVHPCVCVTCMKAKITRTVSRKPMTKFENPCDRVHVDLYGLMQIKSLQGNKIMIIFTDQSSKMVEVDLLPYKKADTILDCFKKYLIRCETTFGKQNKVYRLQEIETRITWSRGIDYPLEL